jgi:hypothetical protein
MKMFFSKMETIEISFKYFTFSYFVCNPNFLLNFKKMFAKKFETSKIMKKKIFFIILK